MDLQWKITRANGRTVMLGSPSTAMDREEMQQHLSHALESHNWDWAPGDTLELVTTQ